MSTLSHRSVKGSGQRDRLDLRVIESHRQLGQRMGADLLAELYRLFLRQGSTSFPRLHRALGAGDAELLAELAHGLKGSCRSLGAVRLGELCWWLEKTAGDGHLQDVPRQLEAIELEYELTTKALGAILQTPELSSRP